MFVPNQDIQDGHFIWLCGIIYNMGIRKPYIRRLLSHNGGVVHILLQCSHLTVFWKKHWMSIKSQEFNQILLRTVLENIGMQGWCSVEEYWHAGLVKSADIGKGEAL